MLHLELPPEAEAQLEVEAAKRGLSKEDYALHKLLLPEPELAQEETAGAGILRIAERMRMALGESDWNSLPPDFAANHEHYLHGAAKEKE